ncbi:hypothetical protein EAF04_004203 [Stromatinia cepivora]|nr:hypothetical protein EAF04_004203 [Stromatinia cepivora]
MSRIWYEAKNCVSYFCTLSAFTLTTLLLVPGLVFACYHQGALQLLTLTTASATAGKTSGSLNATNGGGNDFTYKIYLWYYCVSGVAAEAGKFVNVADSCHQTKQALTEHILPSLNSTFTPPLPRPDIPGPIQEISNLFQHYACPAFASYVVAILLLLIFAGLFIWWFGATATPHKKTLILVLSIFTACFTTLATLQTYLCYHTIYILTQTINLSKSTLNITITPGFLYLLIAHLFWITLLFNILIIPTTICIKRRRARRELRALEAEAKASEAAAKETLDGDTKVCSTPAESAELGFGSNSDDELDMPHYGMPLHGLPPFPHGGMPHHECYGYSIPAPAQQRIHRKQRESRSKKAKREQGKDEERKRFRGGEV